MLEHYCDALIIGTDLSGLITGAFLARRGLTVHVIDLDQDLEDQPDPFCVGHLHSKLLRSIMGRLNVPDIEIQEITPHDSPLQIIFPKKRIDVSANPVLFYEELEREFPKEFEDLKKFYENLAQIKHEIDENELYTLLLPEGFRQKRQFQKFIKEKSLNQRWEDLGLQLNPSLKSFFMSQLKLLIYNHNKNPFAFQVAELLNPGEGEVLSIKGGHNDLKKIFLERIEHHEGAVRSECIIDELLYRNGIFEGVKLHGNAGSVLARYLVWNTEISKLADYLPSGFRFRKIRKQISKIKPSHHWYTCQFSIPKKFIPSPMKENLLCIRGESYKLEEGNYLYLQVHQEDAINAKLSVSYLCDTTWLEKDFQDFDRIHQSILDYLKSLFPFSGSHCQLVFPLQERDENLETLFPLKDNPFETFKKNARSHPICSNEAKSFSDLFPISHRTPAPNLFLSAPEILSSLGYEGKYMLGLKVTDLIWDDVEKEKKRAMKSEKRIA